MDMFKFDEFVYNFFLPQRLYISSIRSSLNRTTIYKLIVRGIELRAAPGGKENNFW